MPSSAGSTVVSVTRPPRTSQSCEVVAVELVGPVVATEDQRRDAASGEDPSRHNPRWIARRQREAERFRNGNAERFRQFQIAVDGMGAAIDFGRPFVEQTRAFPAIAHSQNSRAPLTLPINALRSSP